MSNSGNFKLLLTDFLERGGTILCFASQDSEDYQVIPVPEEETLHAQGWRNMQSCLYNSVYFPQMHPIFSGQTSQRISAGVDGGFSAVPTGTTVLLRRTANNEPALIAYPYGQNGGMVILNATYSDWSFSKGYCSPAEVKLIRDIVTYCKSPLPIPMFNLEDTPNPGIALAVKIKNSTTDAAALAKLTAYTPDRDQVLYETQQSIALNPGEETEIPVEFTLPNLENSQMGIGHVDYELYDQENNLIQLAEESAAVAKTGTTNGKFI